ncbi:MAG: hypothetical protein WCH84_05745, partial [Verrucomicrobiota bacterium]
LRVARVTGARSIVVAVRDWISSRCKWSFAGNPIPLLECFQALPKSSLASRAAGRQSFHCKVGYFGLIPILCRSACNPKNAIDTCDDQSPKERTYGENKQAIAQPSTKPNRQQLMRKHQHSCNRHDEVPERRPSQRSDDENDNNIRTTASPKTIAGWSFFAGQLVIIKY